MRVKNLILLLAATYSIGYASAQDRVSVNTNKVLNHITPYLYGAGMEDVNHEVYGGAYDQRIFGESFEEGAEISHFNNFTTFDNPIKSDGEVVFIQSAPYAKMICNAAPVERGSVEVDIRFDNLGIGSVGRRNGEILIHVNNAESGIDNFDGYEIALSESDIKFGRHIHDYKEMGRVAFKAEPFIWYRMRVEFDKSHFKVYVNEEYICQFHDSSADAICSGQVGLRGFNTDISFRHFKLNEKDITFSYSAPYDISRMWSAFHSEEASYHYRIDTQDSFNGEKSQFMESRGEGIVGISNMGLNRWGIATQKGQIFEGKIHLKGQAEKVWVALQSADGKRELARAKINNISDDWSQHNFRLKSTAQDDKARFAIYIEGKGSINIDQVMLMLHKRDRFRSTRIRKDIGEAFLDQGLTFLRYGGSMTNATDFRWANMTGDPASRPPYHGQWYRHSTNGFNIKEFVEFASAAEYTLSFAVNINDKPEDVAAMVEYFNGDANTKWGSQRVRDGHKKPYGIKYIEIGNEEVIATGLRQDYEYYIQRFLLLSEAMRKVDPELKFIHAAWWRADRMEDMEMVFRRLDGKADYWDFHPWVDDVASALRVENDLRLMQRCFQKWNPQSTMKVAIFEENGNSHGIRRMLGHVITQNAVRRIGDFVLCTCPANALEPYHQNDNGWNQGQIFFTPDKVWGMPPYHAQKLSSKNHQPLLIESHLAKPNRHIDLTATRSEDGKQVVLHIANTSPEPQHIQLTLNDFGKVKRATAYSISGRLSDVNTPEEPNKITCQEQSFSYSEKAPITLKPYSYTVLKFNR